MWDLIIEGALALLGGLAIGATVSLVAWSIVEVVKAAANYLRKKSREYGIIQKRKALNDLINSTDDPEIKRDLRTIRDEHKGLLIPLDSSKEPCFDEITVIAPENASRDTMADEILVADDGSYKELC